MLIRKYTLEQNKQVPFLVKENETIWNDKNDLCSPREVADMVNKIFHLNKKSEEHVYMVCMNSKCVPNGVFEVSHGTVCSSIVSPREIMQRALLCGATGFILLHNHPSGCTKPSMDDMQIARNVKEAGKLMNIHLLDFIIVGEDDFWSFKENQIEEFKN